MEQRQQNGKSGTSIITPVMVGLQFCLRSRVARDIAEGA